MNRILTFILLQTVVAISSYCYEITNYNEVQIDDSASSYSNLKYIAEIDAFSFWGGVAATTFGYDECVTQLKRKAFGLNGNLCVLTEKSYFIFPYVKARVYHVDIPDQEEESLLADSETNRQKDSLGFSSSLARFYTTGERQQYLFGDDSILDYGFMFVSGSLWKNYYFRDDWFYSLAYRFSTNLLPSGHISYDSIILENAISFTYHTPDFLGLSLGTGGSASLRTLFRGSQSRNIFYLGIPVELKWQIFYLEYTAGILSASNRYFGFEYSSSYSFSVGYNFKF